MHQVMEQKLLYVGADAFCNIINSSIYYNPAHYNTHYYSLAPAGIFSGGGSEVHHGKACKGVAAWGFRGAAPPDAGEVFKNFVKKQ